MSMQIKLARVRTGGGMAGRVRSGDPGLLSFLGKAAGAVGGFILGGPAGAAAGVGLAGKILGGGSKPAVTAPTFAPTTSFPVVPSPGVGGAVARLLPGGSTGYQVNAPAAAAGGLPPKGYRLNKSGYFTKDGSYHAPGTKYVKIRRRNSMNPRALSRAMSRLEGAKGVQHKLAGFTTPRYTSAGKRKDSGS